MVRIPLRILGFSLKPHTRIFKKFNSALPSFSSSGHVALSLRSIRSFTFPRSMLSLWLAATTAETPPVFQQQHAPEKPIGAPCFPTAGGGDIFAGLDLTGKTALVTGSNGGIGSEIAVALAAHNAQVILTWRKTGDCENQTLAIKKMVPNANLVCPAKPLDLSSFSVVRDFATQVVTV